MKRTILLVSLLVPLTVQAEPDGNLDLYFTPSAKLEVTIPGLGSGDDDGDGFGVRGRAVAGDYVAFTGEYQSNSYDDSGIDVDQLRFGVGLFAETGSGAYVEYADVDLNDQSVDGFGIHGRLAGNLSETVSVYGQVGYLSLEDDFEKNRGPEISVGAVLWFNDKAGLFADFRRSQVEGEDSDVEVEFSDFRMGVRLGL